MADRADGKAAADPPGGEKRRAPVAAQPIVAFDFDGTLTVRDSFNAFLAWRTTRLRLAVGLVTLIPALVAYAVRRDRGRLKTAAVRVFLRGMTRNELARQASAFAQQAARSLLRADAVERWEAHRRGGARLIIVTASPEEVVQPFARRLGADDLIGTRLAFDAERRVTGSLDGANCRGTEKVRRLQAAFGPDVTLQAAYGDTAGDREMLALAQGRGGMKVFSGRPAR